MPKITDKEMEQLKNLKKRQKDQNEYLKDKYDRVNITVNKGYKEKIKDAAKSLNVSVNEFCRNAIINAVNNSALCNTQNVEISVENQESEESTALHEKPENKPINGNKTKLEPLDDLQSLIYAKKAEQDERKRMAEERKEQEKKEQREEFKSTIYGVLEGLKADAEHRRKEDEEKYKQLSDGYIEDLLLDVPFSEWLENTGYENALEPLSEEMGIINAERVISAAKEKRRGDSISKSQCVY